jgi:hypothetical protein
MLTIERLFKQAKHVVPGVSSGEVVLAKRLTRRSPKEAVCATVVMSGEVLESVTGGVLGLVIGVSGDAVGREADAALVSVPDPLHVEEHVAEVVRVLNTFVRKHGRGSGHEGGTNTLKFFAAAYVVSRNACGY